MIRPFTEADRRFVLSGWSSSWRSSRDIAFVPFDSWPDYSHPLIHAAIDRVTTLIDEGIDRRGFISFEGNCVWYCYIAQPFRGYGIARDLFAAAGIDPSKYFEYAVRTKASWECRGKIPLAHYAPYRARSRKETNERDSVRQEADSTEG